MSKSMSKEVTIFATAQLRKLWPDPLASHWLHVYPQVFDEDDFRITRRQPTKHFNEWLAAVHLFHRDGVYSLIEKYAFANHSRKRALIWKDFE